MTDWTNGYVADVGYTFGCYPELNPERVRLAFLDAGLVPPDVATACELGFGQGVSINAHAAATQTRWFGTDFNPSQAAHAQALAAASGADLQVCDQAFDAFCSRSDLPDFDYIGLHGIWSWISDENRALIVDFVRRKLKVGGVLYVSYNTLPGWASFAPMRHLLTQHAEVMGAAGPGIVNRIDGALAFAQKLMDTQPNYARHNAGVADRLKRVAEQNRNYLAHEYFNRDWQPMYFSDMAEWLAPAKLSYACSAHYLDHQASINLSPEHQQLLAGIADPLFRESVRDFMVNQQFRRDYWVKGPRKLMHVELAQAQRAQRVVLITWRADISLKVTGNMAEAEMSAAVYNPILDLLSDCKPRSLAQIETALKPQGISLPQLMQAVVILIGAGHLSPAREEAQVAKAAKTCQRLNAHLMNKALSSDDVNYLVSPVTGSGIAVTRFQQIYLLAAQQGRKTPAEWAAFAWDIVSAQDRRVIKNGVTLQDPQENLAHIGQEAATFATKNLPVLKALQVV